MELSWRRILIAAACALVANCHPGSYDDGMVDLRHSDECMLVVFEADMTHESLEDFSNEFVRSADSEPGGWRFREGLISMIRRRVPGHEAYEYCFAPEADRALRDSIRSEIEGASGVLRVEDVEIE